MIPKTIHYCWFGGSPLPKSALKCIQSWKKHFPDYEIKEWNESNYDVHKIPYISEAYEAKKYAFVSDYARFDIIYNHGGIYFDTDVEVIKPFDDILDSGAFFGCETDGGDVQCRIAVAPGLGIGAPAGLDIYKEILDYYGKLVFANADGTLNTQTVVAHTTSILKNHGLNEYRGIQTLENITIYPKEYFNPLNNNTGKIDKTGNTHSIHHYSMTWLSKKARIKSSVTRVFHRMFGEDCFSRFKRK